MLFYLQMLSTDEERSKFEDLYHTYKNFMLSIAWRILQNQYDTEDAVHQAFVSLLENLKKIDEINTPKTKAYVAVIVENKSIDIIRKRQQLSDAELNETVYGIEIPLPGDNGLADALAKLPARYREVILLKFYFGYETDEIGKMFHIKTGSAQRLIWRAKDALRKEYEKNLCQDNPTKRDKKANKKKYL